MTSQAQPTPRRVVVGLDGSEESVAALQWAADEVKARGGQLEVVCAWELPFSGLAASYSPEPSGLPNAREVERQTTEALDSTVQQVLGNGPASDVRRVVRGGDPATVLLDQVGEADLLVVGSRGQGGFHRLQLGSVSEKVVRHAPCTVVVVRPPVQSR
jgi:nucleotide-binding universal stress UspA family protein